MAMIVAGRFTTFDEAEGGARHLYERAFGPDDVSIFFLNPGGQHARFPIGGDVYADSAAKPGGRGAMIVTSSTPRASRTAQQLGCHSSIAPVVETTGRPACSGTAVAQRGHTPMFQT